MADKACVGCPGIARARYGLSMLILVAVGGLVVGGCRKAPQPPAASPMEAVSNVSGSPGGSAAPADTGQPGSNLMPTGMSGQTVRTPEPPPFLATAPLPGTAGAVSGTPTAAESTGIAGTVTDSQGQPIVDVAVAIVESSQPVPAMAAFTDATGHYLWRIGPGTYTLEAYRDGYRPARQEVTVEKGKIAAADFRLEPQ